MFPLFIGMAIWHLIWHYLPKPVLEGHPVLSRTLQHSPCTRMTGMCTMTVMTQMTSTHCRHSKPCLNSNLLYRRSIQMVSGPAGLLEWLGGLGWLGWLLVWLEWVQWQWWVRWLECLESFVWFIEFTWHGHSIDGFPTQQFALLITNSRGRIVASLGRPGSVGWMVLVRWLIWMASTFR